MKSDALLKFIGGGETNIQDGEEMPVPFTIAEELDAREFRQFYEEKYQNPLDEADLPRLLTNLRLADGDRFNVAGALL
ncbi:MAG TPA: hypothetical protein PKL15_05330, partial [Saprospiraceae bacterium]|nr:hypothetical protein [Saprospiraceae bacterium]